MRMLLTVELEGEFNLNNLDLIVNFTASYSGDVIMYKGTVTLTLVICMVSNTKIARKNKYVCVNCFLKM